LSQESTNREYLEQLTELLTDEKRFYWDFRFAASNYFYIIDKQKRKVKFAFNSLQEKLFRAILMDYPIRKFILKSRKFGISTFVLLLFYWDCITTENTTSTIIAHTREPSEQLFRIIDFAHKNLPDNLRPETTLDNVRELKFKKTFSTFFVGSAGSKDFGRSANINNLHCSEYAFWPDPSGLLNAALLEAVPEESGNVFIETTPSRHPDLRALVRDCKNTNNAQFDYLFYPWHVFPEYSTPLTELQGKDWIEEQITDDEKIMQETHNLTWEQMKFWLNKRLKLKKNVWREYPPDDITCFRSADDLNFFDENRLQKILSGLVDIKPIEERDNGRIRIYKSPQVGKRYIIAADTSEGVPGGSYSAAVCIEYRSAEEMFELRGHYTPPQLGHTLATLGEEYNLALIAVERNNHGHSVLNTLTNQRYYVNLYYHLSEAQDEKARKAYGVGKNRRHLGQDPFQGTLGWPTNVATKCVMFDDLRDDVIDSGHMIIKSEKFVEECFEVKAKDGKIFSEEFIDTVIARGIVWQVRQRATPYGIEPSEIPKPKERKQNMQNLPWEQTDSRQGRRQTSYISIDADTKEEKTYISPPRKREIKAGWE
jgi:hypothetical protein